MKIIQITIAIICIAMNIQAQSMRHPVKLEAGLAIGLLPTFLKDHGKTIVQPLALTASYRLAPQFSLGLFGGFSVTDTRREPAIDGSMTQCRNRFISTGLRAAIHTRHIEKWEAYGGVSLGMQFSHLSVLEGDINYLKQFKQFRTNVSRLSYTGFIGGRYRISPGVGVFGEIGLGVSLLTTGVQLRWHKGGKVGIAKR